MFEYERGRAATDVRKASERLRELSRNAAPGVWRVVEDAGTVRLTGREGMDIAVLLGTWAPSTAHYLTTVAPDTAFLMAEILWRSQSLIRKGEMPSQIQSSLSTLARTILDP
ncbi:hypothetical protein [Actinocrispum wychmicini]|uniref:Uncharacterized protein n=1 Tax=Actinocrispum wychmicini TaxID=1213861 RepID=A0A4V2S724_9PSEU|nr:hypothetical protein [Actinocrispum wychmicini]TCO58260.1 hypothetical protein EV192_105325 [Actinocrispum wychmicini]